MNRLRQRHNQKNKQKKQILKGVEEFAGEKGKRVLLEGAKERNFGGKTEEDGEEGIWVGLGGETTAFGGGDGGGGG